MRVITKTYVTFEDFLKGMYNLNTRMPGAGCLAMYVDDYLNFFESNEFDVEFDVRPKLYESCLTSEGKERLKQVRELNHVLLISNDQIEKDYIIKQLRDLRLTNEYQVIK